jgi:hypothetical protein
MQSCHEENTASAEIILADETTAAPAALSGVLELPQQASRQNSQRSRRRNALEYAKRNKL